MPRCMWGFLFGKELNGMKSISLQDTIVALATPHGRGAIAVIRISGDKAIKLTEGHLGEPGILQMVAPRRALLSHFYDERRQLLDQVMVTKFLAPASYTGEEVVEISCHGSPYIAEQIVYSLIQDGCRPAQPGEFTQRAFLNGKIDLIQAEAVADLISSATAKTLGQALNQLQGNLSHKLATIRQRLLDVQSLLVLELDFQEGEEFVDRQIFKQDLTPIQDELTALIDSYRFGRVLREGLHIAIVGKTNVGKSSLLNLLLKTDRAIVSEIPGTTRDSLEESLNIRGYLFKISDTAGLRATHDTVEKLGMNRTSVVMSEADLLLVMVDASKPLDEEDAKIIADCQKMAKEMVLVCNKKDLNSFSITDLSPRFPSLLSISCKTGEGLAALEDYLVATGVNRHPQLQEIFIDKARHWQSLVQARNALQRATVSLQEGLSSEFISLDLGACLDALGEITGQITSQDVLNNIFAKFCVGK